MLCCEYQRVDSRRVGFGFSIDGYRYQANSFVWYRMQSDVIPILVSIGTYGRNKLKMLVVEISSHKVLAHFFEFVYINAQDHYQ